jgi:hypothetical protein
MAYACGAALGLTVVVASVLATSLFGSGWFVIGSIVGGVIFGYSGISIWLVKQRYDRKITQKYVEDMLKDDWKSKP